MLLYTAEATQKKDPLFLEAGLLHFLSNCKTLATRLKDWYNNTHHHDP
jgi:hypothetical protein